MIAIFASRFKEPLDLLRLADLKEAFIESDLPFKVDVLDWATVNDRFRQVIEKEYAVLKKVAQ